MTHPDSVNVMTTITFEEFTFRQFGRVAYDMKCTVSHNACFRVTSAHVFA